MKVFAINSNYNQTPFIGKKKKYEKLPDYQNYYYEKGYLGKIGPISGDRAKNAIKLINNKDLKILAQNYYDTEHYISPNVAGFILGMDAGLENIKDKSLKNEIKNTLRYISKNIEQGEKYYDNYPGINLISDMIDTYNTLNGNYSRYFIPELVLDRVEYKLSPVKHYMEFIDGDMPYISERTHQDLDAIFECKKNYKCTTIAKDIIENQRTEAYSYIAKYYPFNNYMYKKYYLNTSKISPEVRKMCLDILNQFGTQVILSDTDKNKSINDLKEIKKELNLWKKYGKDEARFPYIINLSRIDNSHTDDRTEAYYSKKFEGIFLMCGLKDNLRHEMTHLNDRLLDATLGDKNYIKFLKSIMPSKTVVINGKEEVVQDFENCKYREEFLKAGVFPSDIKYAYTNKKEFIAVASQGDMREYSDEFKNVLVKMGLPEFALKLPQTNNEIISNVNQVKRIMKNHPECKDYDSILRYCEY